MNLNVIAVPLNSNRNVKSRSPVTRGAGLFLALTLFSLIFFTDQTRASAAADSVLLRVVVEIPAGEHRKIEFNKETEQFEVDRIISYLPYPVNYGFIPGTWSDPLTGGDGDPIDVMILSTRLNTGHELMVLPVATLRLTDRGEQDDKVLAVPVDEALQIIHCITWQCILDEFPLIPELLEGWFTSYKGAGVTTSEGWAGTEITLTLIREAEVAAYQEQ
jgi:inorganic pyrophosphatase